jgi:NitT/TauT family transport system permease protein
VTNPRGLGHAMTMAAQALQPELVWATLIWVGVVGWAANWLLERAGRR